MSNSDWPGTLVLLNDVKKTVNDSNDALGLKMNSTIGTPAEKTLDKLFDSEIATIFEGLKIPKFTKAVIASGSFTIPKDGTYKIIACGAGGASEKGGGGCAIDQRDYVAGDILTLTVSGAASAVCAARSLSMTANGTTKKTGATASGGNVANYTGGTCTATLSTSHSSGCGAGGSDMGASREYTGCGGDGGIIGGDAYPNHDCTGGTGGIIGGNSSGGATAHLPKGGYGGIFGGNGGDNSSAGSSKASATMVGGEGGDGGYVGGNGGYGGSSTSSYKGAKGGNGGYGSVLGGTGGDGGSSASSTGGKGGDGGSCSIFKGNAGTEPVTNVGGIGGSGAFNCALWTIPFKEVKTEKWTKGNAIIFIEEV